MRIPRFLPLLWTVLLVAAAPARGQPATDGGASADAGRSGLIITVSGDEDDEDRTAPHHRRHHDGPKNDRVNIGGSVTVKEGETVDDAVAIGGALEVLGHVRGSAVSVGGGVHLGPRAHVDGDVVAVGAPLTVDDGADIDGERVSVGTALGIGGLAGLAGLAGAFGTFAAIWSVATMLFSIFGLIAIGALFIAFIPERLERMKQLLLERPLPSFGVGTLEFVGIVPATVLLIVTIIGILFVPFLWMFFGVLVTLGLVIAAQIIGERLLRGTRYSGPVPALALGALILSLARLVPVLGTLVFVVAMIAGSGVALLSRLGAVRPASGPVVPATPVGPMGE